MNTSLNSDSANERLIGDLASALAPVHRLRPPSVRAVIWLAVVAATAVVLAEVADLPAVWHRLGGAPDMWLAVTGSTLTTILAAIAAFQLSLPDARRTWALLPLPAALLWIVASGVGCLRTWFLPGTHVADLSEARDCLIFIVGLAVPLSVSLIVMLRRAYPLQPGLTALVAGLASAAAAATLLNFFHPFDAAATDLTVHAFAVAIVIGANWGLRGRLLATNFFTQRRNPYGGSLEL
jgi:hypothetical protein